MILPKYKDQVNLLLQVLPQVSKEKEFALKGGTAINLFVRDMPRLSVDIDLTYISFDDRQTALKKISEALKRIKDNLEKTIRGINVINSSSGALNDVKLNCQLKNAQIKIEVNTTTRGIILPVRILQVTESVQDEFGKFAAINVVSHAELYGGKICAALDRQHPRDLFDVHLLLNNEGYTEDVKQGFMVALLSHMRTMTEILKPNLINQKSAFDNQFAGMTAIPFNYQAYEETRNKLIEVIHASWTESDKSFLLSFKQGIPDWDLFPIQSLKDMPAVKWKLENINTLKRDKPKKHEELINLLKKIL